MTRWCRGGVTCRLALWATLVASATLLSACSREPYVPGLGEIMTLQQMRHTKLWLAGDAGNWDLAQYEVDELGEGFEDVLRYYPTREGSPVAPADAIPKMVDYPMELLEAAVEAGDRTGFDDAYDQLTEACNSCHEAMNFGFNNVQRPGASPYPDQVFMPEEH